MKSFDEMLTELQAQAANPPTLTLVPLYLTNWRTRA
jgi:hypothetical protein